MLAAAVDDGSFRGCLRFAEGFGAVFVVCVLPDVAAGATGIIARCPVESKYAVGLSAGCVFSAEFISAFNAASSASLAGSSFSVTVVSCFVFGMIGTLSLMTIGIGTTTSSSGIVSC